MQPLATKTGSSFTERDSEAEFKKKKEEKKKVGGEERESKKSRRVDFKQTYLSAEDHSLSPLLGKLL